jgi:Family of unknown function (DUF6174)
MLARSFAALGLAVLLAGCDVDFDVDKIVDRVAIRTAKRKWQEENIHDYVFVYREQCNCAGNADPSGTRVIVHDDKAESAVGTKTGVPFPDGAVTIDDLFDRVLAKTEDGADDFDVHYDKERNFIDNVTLDPDENTKDDEYGFSISCFSPEDMYCAFPMITAEECQQSAGKITPIPQEDPQKVCGGEPTGGFGQVERDVSVCCPG